MVADALAERIVGLPDELRRSLTWDQGKEVPCVLSGVVGLVRVMVLEVAQGGDGRLHVAIETTDDLAACASCGCRAEPKDRDRVGFADLPACGSPVRLVWAKRRWACPEPACPMGTGPKTGLISRRAGWR